MIKKIFIFILLCLAMYIFANTVQNRRFINFMEDYGIYMTSNNRNDIILIPPKQLSRNRSSSEDEKFSYVLNAFAIYYGIYQDINPRKVYILYKGTHIGVSKYM